MKKKLSVLASSEKYAINGGPFGSKLVSKDYVANGVPVIRGCNLPDNAKFSTSGFVFVSDAKADELIANTARPGDLIFTQRGTLGQVGIVPTNTGYSRFIISQSQMKMSVNESEASTNFLYYYFKHPDVVHNIQALAIRAGVPHINLDILRNYEVDAPSLPIQCKIATILSVYDDLIGNNTRRIQILEETVRALYREWFVNFRYPARESVSFVETEIGKVPKGWDVDRFDKALVLQRGFDLPTHQRIVGNIPIYASTGIAGYHNVSKVKGPGVITGRSGSLGSVMYSENDFWPLNTSLWVKEFKRASPILAFYMLSNMDLKGFNSGAAVPTLNRNDIHEKLINIPPRQLIDKFDEIALPIIRQVNSLRSKNENLRQTRDLLLPKLVSGEIDVSDVDISTVEIVA